MADFNGGVFRLNDNKAGLSQLEGGLSKEDVSRILTKASEGSPFYKNKKLRHQAIEQRISIKKKQLEEASEDMRREALAKADQLLAELERERDLSRSIVHVDMDMFYAAVEMRDNPSLRNKPLGVGSNSMLSTSNYIARKYGVRAAQPGFMARKLCPDLVIVPPNFTKYREVGTVVRRVFAEYDPNFSSFSLDEAYLDITEHLKNRASFSEEARTLWRCDCSYLRSVNPKWSPEIPEDTGSSPATKCESCGRPAEKIIAGLDAEGAVLELRTKVFRNTSLTCSAGIAPNTMLAKVCTDKNKPNGQYKLPSTKEAVLEFTHDLPVRKIPGIGATTEEMLQAFGVKTCSDLFVHRMEVAIAFSELSLEHFMRVSLGIGSTTLEGGDEDKKSISNERTFRELSKPEDLYKKLEELTADLVGSMHDEGLCGKCVTLKIKLVNFETKTRAHTVPYLIRRTDEIFPVAKKLLEQEIRNSNGPLKLRLMGVRMSQLQPIDSADHQQQATLTKYLRKSPEKSMNTAISPIELKGHSRESVTETPQADPVKKEPVVLDEIVIDDDDDGDSVPTTSHQHRSLSTVTCPNCSRPVQTDDDLVRLNNHIDDCLSRKLILTEQNTPTFPTGTSSKRLRLSDPVISSPKSIKKSPVVKKITDYLKK